MKEDYDDFDRALLRAGRNARPPSRLRTRALTAAGVAGAAGASGASGAAAAKTGTAVGGAKATASLLGKTAAVVRMLTVKWALVAVGGTASLGGAAYVLDRHVLTAPAAGPSSEVVRIPNHRSAANGSGSELVSAAPPSAAAPPPPPSPAATTTALRDEILLVESARRSLAGGNAASALLAVEEHALRFPSGVLAVERDVLRIDALVAAGRNEAAASQGARVPRAAPERRTGAAHREERRTRRVDSMIRTSARRGSYQINRLDLDEGTSGKKVAYLRIP